MKIIYLFSITLLFTLSECSSRETPATIQSETKKEITEKPMTYKSLIRTDTTETGKLIQWLNENNNIKLIVPVIVTFDEFRMGIKKAIVNQNGQKKDEIPLQLDDTPMSISLATKLLQLCPEDQLSCLVYVEGKWGPLSDSIQAVLDSANLSTGYSEKKWPFVVFNVHSHISEAASSVTIYAVSQ